MKYAYLLFYALSVPLLFSACQQKDGSSQEPSGPETSVVPMIDAKFVCTLMQGWQDEQQDDDGFHYEEIRRFVVSEK